MQVFIEKIVNGGYGLGRKNGRVFLVPYAVPGDVLEVRPANADHLRREGALFGEIRRIVKPSSKRLQPQCPVFGLCGGCDYDHLNYEYELTVKRDVLLEDLRRIAGVAWDDVEILRSPREYGYRNHAYVRVNEEGRPGFFMKRSHRVIPFPKGGCLLLDRRLNEVIEELMCKAPVSQGALRMRSNHRGEIFLKGVPDRPDDARACYRVGDLEFEIGIDDFFQVNRYLNEQWVRSIAKYLEPRPGDFLLDLFCGSGLIALSLARSLLACVGVEANGNAVRNARLNAERNGIENVSFLLKDLTRQIDLENMVPAREDRLKVVMDPPRTGIASHMIESIVKLNPSVVVYVSCNSATFARDLKLFRNLEYRVERFVAIDMFPRTHHVETIACIIPAGAAGLHPASN